MQEFNYHRPSSIADAANIIGELEDAKLLAGGMTLIPTMKQRLAAPSDIVDLSRIPELKGVRLDGKGVIIGAMTRHAEVAGSSLVLETIPALASLAGQIGDPAVRHRGTLGGSISNADPAADYPAAVVGLDAIVETNQRQIAGDDFFTGLFDTALEPGEIVTGVRFRAPDRANYQKFRHPASGYAVVGVMVARFGSNVRVAITGAGPSVFRVAEMEAALTKSFAIEAIASINIDANELLSDMHASAEYRAHVASVLAKRAVAAIA